MDKNDIFDGKASKSDVLWMWFIDECFIFSDISVDSIFIRMGFLGLFSGDTAIGNVLNSLSPQAEQLLGQPLSLSSLWT
jgi:ethanolamine utilization microcompartment shell protein EutS